MHVMELRTQDLERFRSLENSTTEAEAALDRAIESSGLHELQAEGSTLGEVIQGAGLEELCRELKIDITELGEAPGLEDVYAEAERALTRVSEFVAVPRPLAPPAQLPVAPQPTGFEKLWARVDEALAEPLPPAPAGEAPDLRPENDLPKVHPYAGYAVAGGAGGLKRGARWVAPALFLALILLAGLVRMIGELAPG